MKKVAYIISGTEICYGQEWPYDSYKRIDCVYLGKPGLDIEKILKKYKSELRKFQKNFNKNIKKIEKDPVLWAKHKVESEKLYNKTWKEEIWLMHNYNLEKIDFIEYEN